MNKTEQQRWVALHEAAHFVAAVFYDLPVRGVWLSVAKKPRKGVLGEVKMFVDDNRADLVTLAAGPAADERILTPEQLENALGYKRELDQLSKETADALKFKHSDMYLHDREPQEADINEALNRITNEARSLVDENWDVIERVAEAFLDSRNKSTGEIARTKLDKIITMTEDLINQSG